MQEISKSQMESLKQYAMSNDDINECLFNDKTVFKTYQDLYNCDDIMDDLDNYGRMMLLLPVQSTTNGHWVCMFYNENVNEFHYWDPYGLKPDYFKTHWLKPPQVKQFGIQVNILSELLNKVKKSGIKLIINSYDYQSYQHHPATCGRWCAVRLMCRSISDAKFKSLVLSSDMPKDNVVTTIVYSIIGK